jgi:hypothetical protein
MTVYQGRVSLAYGDEITDTADPDTMPLYTLINTVTLLPLVFSSVLPLI